MKVVLVNHALPHLLSESPRSFNRAQGHQKGHWLTQSQDGHLGEGLCGQAGDLHWLPTLFAPAQPLNTPFPRVMFTHRLGTQWLA